MASCPVGGPRRGKSPGRTAPQQTGKRGGGGEVVEEVTEETIFETFAEVKFERLLVFLYLNVFREVIQMSRIEL